MSVQKDGRREKRKKKIEKGCLYNIVQQDKVAYNVEGTEGRKGQGRQWTMVWYTHI